MNNWFLAVFADTAKGVKGYIKSQIIMCIITWIILLIGFQLIGIEYGVLKGLGIALVDAVPVIGSGIIMIPWAIYRFATGSQAIGGQIALLYVVLTVLKQLIQPKVVGDSIGLRPLYTFISAVLGTLIMGPLGVMLGPIAAVIATSVVKYRKLMLYEEEKKRLERDSQFIDVKYTEKKSKDTEE